VFGGRTALWLAVGTGVVALAVQRVRYARLERLGPMATAITVAINLSLGLAIAAMKAVVAR
jgi:hypothetical protein